MYEVDKYIVYEDDALYDTFVHMTAQAKLLHNAVLYRLRQHYTSFHKDYASLQPHQQEVEDEIRLTLQNSQFNEPGILLSYNFLDRLFRLTNNPDFFYDLPMQTSQQIVKKGCREFKAFNHALREYQKNHEKFTGRPKMPKYRKSDYDEVIFTNQDCRVKADDDGRLYLKFPMTKEVLYLRNDRNRRLKEVKVKPWHHAFMVSATFENDKQCNTASGSHVASMDIGVTNLAAFVSNDGSPSILYKGGAVKSINQWYNKRKAALVSKLTRSTGQKYVTSRQLDALSVHRSMKLRDFFHKLSNDIIRTCIQRNVTTLVIGQNTQWKTGSDIGKKNNQNFVQIPFVTLIYMIQYKGERAGIQVVLQEESYTSKASYLDRDEIPTYQKDDHTKYRFSGRRFQRGLYRSSDGTVINADLNGASNIMRKALPSEAEHINLSQIHVVGFRTFYQL